MITVEEINRRFVYCRSTGGLLHKMKDRGPRKHLHRAGCLNYNGYRLLNINKKPYREHRIIYLLHYGYLPENDIDHINGIRDDNRIENLREVSRGCNNQNSCTPQDNTSGFKGVYPHTATGKWVAQARFRGRTIYIGYYDLVTEAALARITWEDWCDDWHCDKRCDNRKKLFAMLGLKKTI